MHGGGGRSVSVMIGIWTVVGLALLSLAAEAGAAIPQKISYQGRLTDPSGNPLPGDHAAMFAIYDDPSYGILLWSESKTITADAEGVFSTILGSVTPLDCSFAEPRWLEIYVDGLGLTPRREIVSVASALVAEQALQAGNADSLGGVAAGSYAEANHTHSSLAASDGDPAQAVYVSSAGKVGINTTSPGYQLSVVADPTGSGCRAVHGAVFNTSAEPDAFGVVGETWSSSSTLAGAGIYGLAQNAAGGANGVAGVSGAAAGSGVFGWADHTSGVNYGVRGVTSSPNGYAGHFSGGRSYLSGNVGIGTDSPDRLLHVYGGSSGAAPHASTDLVVESDGNTSIGFLSPNTSTQSIYFGDADDIDSGWITYSQGGDNLTFGTKGIERMRMDGYGRVGIGVSSGLTEELEVAGTIRVTTDGYPLKLRGTSGGYIDFTTTDQQPMGLRLQNSWRTWMLINGIDGSDILGLYDSDGPAGYERALVVDGPTHKIGIGSSSPTARLDVSNSTGYNQFRMRTSYTPTSTTDPNGAVGDIAWDNDYFYVKTSAGWKRGALSAFGL